VQGALLIALGREDMAGKWRPYRSLATSYLFSAAYEPAGAPQAASAAPSPQ